MNAVLEGPVNAPLSAAEKAKPRLGFLGIGWIGRSRMEAIARAGAAEVTAIADASAELAARAKESAPDATVAASLDELLELGLDGIVIATPSALHAAQCIAALEAGLAVFCQKPLARTGAETRQVIEAARSADRLLGVDLSYRHLVAAEKARELIRTGALGNIFAADLVFHNAYGPDKSWFYDPNLSGGGCVIDLGIHLVDLALWLLDFPNSTAVSSRLFAGGAPLTERWAKVEDFALARLDLGGTAVANLACSWKLPAGCDAIISITLYGTEGGVRISNVNGSFYDFRAEHLIGTRRETLAEPPDAWGGSAAVTWAEQLAHSKAYDPKVERLAQVADVLDGIYSSASK